MGVGGALFRRAIGRRGWEQGPSRALDWVAVPPRVPVRQRIASAIRARLPHRVREEAAACPNCLRRVSARARRCRCGEDLAPEEPMAALLSLGIDWPAATFEVQEVRPGELGAVDPERLRLAELVHELLLGREDAFAVLRCLADPGLSGAIDRYPHQLATVRRVLGELRGRALLADEVGLGKTIEAALVLAELRARGLCRRALILVPPALLDQWQAELGQRFGLPVTRVTRREQWETHPEIALASLYTAKAGRHAAAVAGQQWDLVVIDEAHRLRNRGTQAYRFVRSLRSRYLLLLTATPVQASLVDLHALVDLVRPGLLGTLAQFRRQFDVGQSARAAQPERLRALLRETMIRNRRSTAGIDLPPRRAAIHWIDLPPAERALYDTLCEYAREDGGERSGVDLLRLSALQRRLCSSPRAVEVAVPLDASDPRRDHMRSLIRLTETPAKVTALETLLRLYPDEQFLVFSEFGETVVSIAEHLRAVGESVGHWHGRMGRDARSEALNAFRAGGRRVLVGGDSLAEGQNLQHCRVVVNFDLPWNPFTIEQRIGRVHRIGQRREVFVLSLAARGTFEAELVQVYARKLRLFELSVGELDPILGELADSDEGFERLLLRMALAESADRERLLDDFARTLEDAYLRYRDVAVRQELVPELSALGGAG